MNRDLYFKIGQTYTPHAPITDQALFAGRLPQIQSLLDAVTGKGSHSVIFGERGVGKTSLGNVIRNFLPDDTITFATLGCDSNMTYSTLWYQILQRLSTSTSHEQMGFSKESAEERQNFLLSDMVRDPKNISTQEVRSILENLNKATIILIDEVDRLDKEATKMLADTIKTFSDYNVGVRLIIIGVADSVTNLIAGHESIERNLVQIQMPRMADDEIKEIIANGNKKLAITIDPAVEKKIVSLSRGLPHYTHLLMLHAARSIARENRVKIEQVDFLSALHGAITEKERSLKSEYNKAVESTKNAFLFPYVLLACALANEDKNGYFALTDIQEPLSKIRGEEIKAAAFIRHVGAFSSDERGPILERVGKERKYRYRFKNPLMRTFVIMKAINDNIESKVSIEDLLT